MFSPIKLWIKKKSYKKKDFVSQKNVIGAKDFKSKKRIKIKRFWPKNSSSTTCKTIFITKLLFNLLQD